MLRASGAMTEPGDTHESPLRSAPELQQLLEAERTGKAFVFWRDGSGVQRILILDPDRSRVTISRRENADIPLTWDNEVSRAHAWLEPVDDDWILVDEGMSRNGSYRNGDRIKSRVRLEHDDRLCFGKTVVTFRAAGSGRGSESTARTPGAGVALTLSPMKRKVAIALCRPVVEGTSTTPATNPQIALEVHITVDATKAHLREMFDNFGLGALQQNEKRSTLVSLLLKSGELQPHEF
jgi:hypothetical protein